MVLYMPESVSSINSGCPFSIFYAYIVITTYPQTISFTSRTGIRFAAPDHAVLIHSCKTKGKSTAGIAVPFKTAYPNAFKAYRAHCFSSATPTLVCSFCRVTMEAVYKTPGPRSRRWWSHVVCQLTSRTSLRNWHRINVPKRLEHLA